MNNSQVNQALNILLADDGSEHSQASVNLLCDLPLPKKTKIHIISVFTPRQIDEHLVLTEKIQEKQRCFLEKGIQAEIEIKTGSPAETILDFADKISPNLIVMGAKGLRATLGILLGGVVQQVVEYGSLPVLIVRAPYQGLRQVLLATDGSEHSLRAVKFLAEFPLPKSTIVKVMHILPPLPSSNYVAQTWPLGTEPVPAMPISRLTEETEAWKQEEEREGYALLEDSVALLKSYHIEAESILKRGDAATEIIDYVKRRKVDLIVAGSRGLSQLRSWLLGSVSRKLIHYAGCSVLVVRG